MQVQKIKQNYNNCKLFQAFHRKCTYEDEVWY